MYYVDREKCTGCRLCIERCPAGAISIENRKAIIDGKKCTDCGACEDACRFGAIYSALNQVHSPSPIQDQTSPDARFAVEPPVRQGLDYEAGRGLGRGSGSGMGSGMGSGRGMGRGMGKGMGRGYGRGGGRGCR